MYKPKFDELKNAKLSTQTADSEHSFIGAYQHLEEYSKRQAISDNRKDFIRSSFNVRSIHDLLNSLPEPGFQDFNRGGVGL